MKTVYIVIGWYTGEEDFISSVFENEDDAKAWAEQSEAADEYGCQYRVREWEVK